MVGCWHGYLSGARCRLVYIKAQLMPLPLSVSCFSIIQIGFTFLVPAHQGSPGKRALKRACANTASVAARSTRCTLRSTARELYACFNVVVCVYVRLFVMNVGIAKRRNRSRRHLRTDLRGAKEQSRHVRWGQISRTKVFFVRKSS